MTRRRRSVAIGLSLAAASFTVAGCERQPQPQSMRVYASVEQCRVEHTQAECDAAMKQAASEHDKTAPKFNDRAACEAQYGPGRCQDETVARADGGMGHVFLPMMAGFMLGRMMNGGQNCGPFGNCQPGGGAYGGHPVFAGLNGGLFSGSNRVGDATVSRTGAVGLPTEARASVGANGAISRGVTTRGGFGATASGRGGAGE